MALRNGPNQYLSGAWARPIYPVTVSMWWRHDVTNTEMSLVCIGNPAEELSFHNIQSTEDTSYGVRVISFDSYAQADRLPRITDTTTYHHVFVRYLSNAMQISVDGGAFVNSAWSPSDTQKPNIWIGNSVSDSIFSYLDGAFEHLCVWGSALTDANRTALFNQSVNPLSIDTGNIITYLPAINNLTPAAGAITFTPVNMPTPAYETSGIVYPSLGVSAAVAIAQLKQAVSITANITGQVNASVSAAQKKQSVSITATSTNKRTASFGIVQKRQSVLITLNLNPGSRIIDHTNFDPAARSLAEIQAAAALKTFFAHASVGGYIVGPLTNWPENGLLALQTENNRYTIGRQTWETPTAPSAAWFESNSGIGDYYYGNPGYAAKITDFRARLANSSRALANAVDVAMMKFCYIDAPDVSIWDTGYSAATLFSAYRDAILAEQALSPGVKYVWWTMPLEITGSAGRQEYNELVRAYCTENNQWLFDIAAIESHNDAGVIQLDEFGNELLTEAYAGDAWGHPNSAGALKLARGMWSLLATIATPTSGRTASVGIVQKKQALSITATSENGRTATFGIVQKKQSVSISASATNSRSANISITQKKQTVGIQVNSTESVNANISLNQKKQAVAIIGTSENSATASVSIGQKKQVISINVYTVPHISASVGISQPGQVISIQAESNNDRAASISISQKKQTILIQAESNSNSTANISIVQRKQGLYIKVSEKKIYQPGDIITIGTSDIKLYAQWRPL